MSLWSKRIGTKGTHKYTKDSKKRGTERWDRRGCLPITNLTGCVGFSIKSRDGYRA
jgi:hypothetical protein